MINPPQVFVAAPVAVTSGSEAVATTTVSTVSTYVAPTPVVTASQPTSGLEACIIARETTGANPQAVNGQYGGIGQWQQSTWLADGGGRYSSSPTGASYSQQASVLASEGAAGMAQQQGQWDGCS